MVPVDRKAAAKADRERLKSDRGRQRQAVLSGDEAGMGPRDAGPVRRFVRDTVDARWNVGEFYLLLALVAIVLVLGPQLLRLPVASAARIQLISTAVLWGTIVLVGLDTWRLTRLLRSRLRERFGADFDTRGHVSYGVSRSLQLRRWRLPRAGVQRGESPRR